MEKLQENQTVLSSEVKEPAKEKGVEARTILVGHELSSLDVYYINGLLESIKGLWFEFELPRIINGASGLLFYATNPDGYKDLDKDDVAEMANDVMNFLSFLSNIYADFDTYIKHKTIKQS